MGILKTLGGQKRENYQDFVSRYEQGPPWQGYDDREVLNRYGEVAHEISLNDYQNAAEDAVRRLSPDQRQDFLTMLRDRARQNDITLPRGTQSGDSTSEMIARMLTQIHERPGQLRNLLGGGGGEGGGILDNPLAKAVLAGITAIAARKLMESR